MTHRVIGFDHLVLRTADIDRSLAFYCDRLGLEPVRVDDWRRGDAPFPSVRVSPTSIIDLVPNPPEGTNVDHFCLVLEPTDLSAVAASFPDSHLAHGLFGAQGYASSVYITDPDGNTIELRCYDGT